jgi:DNA-binding LytR/AlgR family response regulator
MKTIIIEDEPLAQAKLEKMLQALDPSIHILARLASVKESLAWLRTNSPPDLAFIDIQLSDDHSFEILRNHPVAFPVIFTTAYDKYLLQSFEFNSIDYLLKPITLEKLSRSLAKVKTLQRHFIQSALHQLVNQGPSSSKKRILAKKGTEFMAVEQDKIAYFHSEQKVVFLRDDAGNRLIVDKNLSELEAVLDPQAFFRINRKVIANRKAIDRFKSDNGKVRIFLKPELKEEVFVSKEGAPAFKRWIEECQ